MKRRMFLSASAAVAALLISGCGLADDTPTYRYRLNVEVDTPQGIKSGSSVIEVDVRDGVSTANPAGSALIFKVKGEAAAIDLPGGRTMFALLRSEPDNGWAHMVMPLRTRNASGADSQDLEKKYQAMIANKDALELPRMWPKIAFIDPRSAYPMLVTFDDLNDPTSVKEVDPDNLAATFGEGFALKRITVQITDDPVTTGIEKRLGWLDTIKGSLVKRQEGQTVGDMPRAHRLGENDFWLKG